MNQLFSVLDILSAIGIIVSLNLVQKRAWAWLLYGLSCFIFAGVMIYNHVPGMTLMGFILTGTGIKNYIKGRKC
jgi:hypothetical protein